MCLHILIWSCHQCRQRGLLIILSFGNHLLWQTCRYMTVREFAFKFKRSDVSPQCKASINLFLCICCPFTITTTLTHTNTYTEQKTHTLHFPLVVSQPLNYTYWLIDQQPGTESIPRERQQWEGERRLVRHNHNGSGLNDVQNIKKNKKLKLRNSLPCLLKHTVYVSSEKHN